VSLIKLGGSLGNVPQKLTTKFFLGCLPQRGGISADSKVSTKIEKTSSKNSIYFGLYYIYYKL
jgi:hypothetical protein